MAMEGMMGWVGVVFFGGEGKNIKIMKTNAHWIFCCFANNEGCKFAVIEMIELVLSNSETTGFQKVFVL